MNETKVQKMYYSLNIVLFDLFGLANFLKAQVRTNGKDFSPDGGHSIPSCAFISKVQGLEMLSSNEYTVDITFFGPIFFLYVGNSAHKS